MSYSDVNECGSNNGGCAHKCINTAGSHRCECPNGRIGCYGGEHICYDIVSYCYILKVCVGIGCIASTSINCDTILFTGRRSCSSNNGGCDHKCTDVVSGPVCSCNSGYELQSDKKSCRGQ